MSQRNPQVQAEEVESRSAPLPRSKRHVARTGIIAALTSLACGAAIPAYAGRADVDTELITYTILGHDSTWWIALSFHPPTSIAIQNPSCLQERSQTGEYTTCFFEFSEPRAKELAKNKTTISDDLAVRTAATKQGNWHTHYAAFQRWQSIDSALVITLNADGTLPGNATPIAAQRNSTSDELVLRAKIHGLEFTTQLTTPLRPPTNISTHSSTLLQDNAGIDIPTWLGDAPTSLASRPFSDGLAYELYFDDGTLVGPEHASYKLIENGVDTLRKARLLWKPSGSAVWWPVSAWKDANAKTSGISNSNCTPRVTASNAGLTVPQCTKSYVLENASVSLFTDADANGGAGLIPEVPKPSGQYGKAFATIVCPGTASMRAVLCSKVACETVSDDSTSGAVAMTPCSDSHESIAWLLKSRNITLVKSQ